MENTVNQSFNLALNYLLERKIVSNKKEFAISMDLKPSYLSEILNNRIKISGDLLQIFFRKYQINPSFIFGLDSEITANTPASTPEITYKNGSKKIIPQNPQGGKLHPKLHPTLHPTQKNTIPAVVTIDGAGNNNIALVGVKTRAGYLNGYADATFIQNLPVYAIPGLSNATFRAFEVEGNSMFPTLNNKDIVFAQWVESLTDIKDNHLYIIVTKNDGIVVKRLLNRINEYGYLIAKSDAHRLNEYPNFNILPQDILEVWHPKQLLSTHFKSPVEYNQRLNNLEADVQELKRLTGIK